MKKLKQHLSQTDGQREQSWTCKTRLLNSERKENKQKTDIQRYQKDIQRR